MAFSDIFCQLYVAFYWENNDDSHMATRNCVRQNKKNLQEISTYCVLFRKKQVTYVDSTVVPISSSLEMIQVLWVFFLENCVLKFQQAEIRYTWSLLAWVQSSTWFLMKSSMFVWKYVLFCLGALALNGCIWCVVSMTGFRVGISLQNDSSHA